jgi:hypothetical protein
MPNIFIGKNNAKCSLVYLVNSVIIDISSLAQKSLSCNDQYLFFTRIFTMNNCEIHKWISRVLIQQNRDA